MKDSKTIINAPGGLTSNNVMIKIKKFKSVCHTNTLQLMKTAVL